MANQDLVAKIAYPLFLRALYQDNVWLGLVQDDSAQVSGYGDTIQYPVDKSTYTLDDVSATYIPNQTTISDLEYGDPSLVTADKVDLTVNQVRKVSKLLTHILDAQVRPSFMEAITTKLGREQQMAVNSYIRDTVFDSANVAATHRLPAITVTAANFASGSDTTFLGKVAESLSNAALLADGAYWPDAGRVCVMSPNMHSAMVDYLLDKNYFVSVALNNRAVVENDILRFKGWDIIKDNSTGVGAANTDDDKHTMRFMIRGETLKYAGQLERFRVIESEKYMGMLAQGLWSWGAVLPQGEKAIIQTVSIT